MKTLIFLTVQSYAISPTSALSKAAREFSEIYYCSYDIISNNYISYNIVI